ncbi:MAG: hypothetical protein P1P90_05025 [Patescibacteria group bacterium]|nr:hypothetical protein [Patescibacteria group bacterium]
MKTKYIFIALTIFFLSWFSFITPRDRFADPDAFYHITVAKLISEQGPLTDFTWLDLTTLGSHFADQHFLFHVLQIPFLKIFDPLTASRISSIFFAVLCMLGISLIFYKLKLKPWWLWPILLAFTQPFTTRLIQGKASPLAILFWFVGIGVVLFCLQRDKLTPTPLLRSREGLKVNLETPPLLILREGAKGVSLKQPNFFAIRYVSLKALAKWDQLSAISLLSFLFTLTHGGWILLPVSIFVIILSYLFLQKSKFVVRNSLFMLVASITGCLAGLIVHPNRSELLSFLKVQLFDVAVATPRILRMGTEWNTSSIESIISMFGVFAIILLLTLLESILSNGKYQIANSKSNNSEIRNTTFVPSSGRGKYEIRLAITLLPLLILLFIASIKSLRFTEYFQPLLALQTALLAQLINWKNLYNKLKLPTAKYEIRNTKFDLLVPSVILFTIVMILVQHTVSAYSDMHFAKRFFNNQYKTPMDAISAIAKPGDRVYNSMWDEFPILFFHNQNLRYISGLDPTFLYKSSSTLALDYQNLVFNSSSTQADTYSLIHDRLHSNFILIDNERWPELDQMIATDERYTFLAEGNGGKAYIINKSP